MNRTALLVALMPILTSSDALAQDIAIPFEKHVLDNGLEVVLHEDHSDPVVAVYVYYHVGSAREEVGRSGFAHLFEHMMFQGSQHVGDDQHFKLVQEAGGTLNGTTNRDRTNYYETLPANQLELALWLESDRMGFLLPSVTQEKLDNQRDVVKNERRQNYENRPYGRVSGATATAMYPADHPYSWLTIGSHEDLTAASLEDVHAFFRRWYGPNNATLAIGGDIDPERALALVEKYFGSIPRGPAVEKPAPRPVTLDDDRRVVIEDSVRLPQLSIAWPSVPMFHEDEAALDVAARILSANKAAVLDRALTVDAELASLVSAYQSSSELAGSFHITLRPKSGVTLEELELRTKELVAGVIASGIDPAQLERAKAGYEADAVRQLETVSSRTSRLAYFNTFLGTPDHVGEALRRRLAVTPTDVVRALARYLDGEPAVYVSTVPRGELPLAASGRTADAIAAEASLDRTSQPAPAPEPAFAPPPVWHGTLANGVEVTGTRYDELPLVQLDLSVPAGKIHENEARAGIASLTASLLDEGTQSLTTTELTEALDAMGARLSVRSDENEISLSMNVLSKHVAKATALLSQIVLQPRFAPEDFERVKNDRLVSIRSRGDSISSTASRAFSRLVFGDTIRGLSSMGTEATISSITRDEVAEYWERHAVPAGARLTVVGDLDLATVQELLTPLTDAWEAPESGVVEAVFRVEDDTAEPTPALYLIDKPGASQSQIRIGHRGVSATHPDWYRLTVLNYILGGSFSSRINLNLREDKGYTYGARSRFSGSVLPGTFVASSGVRSDVTKESVAELMKELGGILEGVTEEELEFARKALVQAMGRRFESTRALASYLDAISLYGYPDDYLQRRLDELHDLTTEDLRALAHTYITPSEMVILVVGDRAEVEGPLRDLGYGEPQLLDLDGLPLE